MEKIYILSLVDGIHTKSRVFLTMPTGHDVFINLLNLSYPIDLIIPQKENEELLTKGYAYIEDVNGNNHLFTLNVGFAG